MRRTTLCAWLMAPLLLSGVAACGTDKNVELDASANKAANPTASATQSAAAKSSKASATTTATSKPTESAKKAAAAVSAPEFMAALHAFESQALDMVEMKADRTVTPAFEKVVTSVDNTATETTTSVSRWAAAAGKELPKSTPDGLLSADQVSNVATPEGVEFESAWKTLMLKQRKAALAYLETNTVDDAKAKKVAATLKASLTKQVSLLNA